MLLTKLKSVVSVRDLSKEQILDLLHLGLECKQLPPQPTLAGKILGCCFFEPSTRTRLSFESAMKRLGGDAIGFAEARISSVSKKETLHDTIKVIGEYVDVIVIRHPLEGAARFAAEVSEKPVINAGDGSNQHPTQTLVDLMSMLETQGKIEKLHVAFVGDLKYGRTVHSLVQAASLFQMRLYFIAHEGLEMPKDILDDLKRSGVMFSFHPALQEIMPRLDIIYMTRVQEERMTSPVVETHRLDAAVLNQAKPTLKVLHPLPRVREIAPEVDTTPYAYYFQQSQNGVFLRQALLKTLLEE